MLILGIDPGSRKTGFGIIDASNNRYRHIDSGVIRLPTEKNLAERLKVLFHALSAIISTHAPEQAVVEQVFMAKGADAALKLGQARGAAIVACVKENIVVHEYSAKHIKKAVVGTGAAVKAQVQHMVKILLQLPELPQEDEADALAAAICHANHARK